jgi:hypothetical protein
MRNTNRRFVALVSAFALVFGVAWAAQSSPGLGDRVNEICVIGGDFSYCAPHAG